MKKYLVLLFSILMLSSTAVARNNHAPKGGILSPAEQATRLAGEMRLSDAVSAKFIPLYIQCCGEIEKVFRKYPVVQPSPGAALSEKQLKVNNDNRMAIARDILNIREKYYKKYTKILTAGQIDILYRAEKRFRRRPPVSELPSCAPNFDALGKLDLSVLRELNLDLSELGKLKAELETLRNQYLDN